VSNEKVGHPAFLAAMAICFIIAALALGGVILRGDTAGRLIFGAVWILVGVVWLGWHVSGFRRNRSRDADDVGER
jgi:type VI protein secretion system component VasK